MTTTRTQHARTLAHQLVSAGPDDDHWKKIGTELLAALLYAIREDHDWDRLTYDQYHDDLDALHQDYRQLRAAALGTVGRFSSTVGDLEHHLPDTTEPRAITYSALTVVRSAIVTLAVLAHDAHEAAYAD